MWGMITALVSGALMSIQGVFNSAVMKQTSMWISAGWCIQDFPLRLSDQKTD